MHHSITLISSVKCISSTLVTEMFIFALKAIKYRVIQNECRGFNNLSYTIRLRWQYTGCFTTFGYNCRR